MKCSGICPLATSQPYPDSKGDDVTGGYRTKSLTLCHHVSVILDVMRALSDATEASVSLTRQCVTRRERRKVLRLVERSISCFVKASLQRHVTPRLHVRARVDARDCTQSRSR